jgi:hypothetical protein
MPGVTMTKSVPQRPQAAHLVRGGNDPSTPPLGGQHLRGERCATPIPARAAASRLVSTVTPRRRRWRARQHPHAQRVAERTAPATVFGMSWNFRSRNTRSPRGRARGRWRGPRREQLAADLEAADHVRAAGRPGRAGAVSTSSATRSGSMPALLPGRRARRRGRRRRAMPWRACSREPSSSFGQMNGSTKLAVPTCTAVAPAIMNSSASARRRCRPCR